MSRATEETRQRFKEVKFKLYEQEIATNAANFLKRCIEMREIVERCREFRFMHCFLYVCIYILFRFLIQEKLFTCKILVMED